MVNIYQIMKKTLYFLTVLSSCLIAAFTENISTNGTEVWLPAKNSPLKIESDTANTSLNSHNDVLQLQQEIKKDQPAVVAEEIVKAELLDDGTRRGSAIIMNFSPEGAEQRKADPNVTNILDGIVEEELTKKSEERDLPQTVPLINENQENRLRHELAKPAISNSDRRGVKNLKTNNNSWRNQNNGRRFSPRGRPRWVQPQDFRRGNRRRFGGQGRNMGPIYMQRGFGRTLPNRQGRFSRPFTGRQQGSTKYGYRSRNGHKTADKENFSFLR